MSKILYQIRWEKVVQCQKNNTSVSNPMGCTALLDNMLSLEVIWAGCVMLKMV